MRAKLISNFNFRLANPITAIHQPGPISQHSTWEKTKRVWEKDSGKKFTKTIRCYETLRSEKQKTKHPVWIQNEERTMKSWIWNKSRWRRPWVRQWSYPPTIMYDKSSSNNFRHGYRVARDILGEGEGEEDPLQNPRPPERIKSGLTGGGPGTR